MIHTLFAMPTVPEQGRRAMDGATTALKASRALVGQTRPPSRRYSTKITIKKYGGDLWK